MKPFALMPLLVGLVLGALGGCQAYQLGLPGQAGEGPRSIFIAPVSNETDAPQVRAVFTEQLRRAFAQSPAWMLASEDQAHYRLEVRLVETRTRTAATREEDTGRGISFAQSYTAAARLLEPDGSVRELPAVETEGVLFETPGQIENAYQALPAMTLRLAESILRQTTLE